MTHSPMIERVARAIALAGNGGTWDDWYNEDQREFHRRRASAALEAMREPSEGMMKAGQPFARDNYPADVWTAMIDAALKGEG